MRAGVGNPGSLEYSVAIGAGPHLAGLFFEVGGPCGHSFFKRASLLDTPARLGHSAAPVRERGDGVLITHVCHGPLGGAAI